MAEVRVYGASDDLIEVEGDIFEEWGHSNEHPALLAFSDGTLLELRYDEDGLWRITRLAEGTATFTNVPGNPTDDVCDVATLVGDLRWCIKGTDRAWAKKKR